MKRDATKVIWRTVVFAGAMLGTPACTKKPPPQTPQNTQTTTTSPTEPTTPTTTTGTEPSEPTPNPAEDCRIRGCDDDGGGGAGRGFVLS